MTTQKRAAAILEAHGSVCIVRITRAGALPRPRYALEVSVWGVDDADLRWLKESFGGSIDDHHAPSRLGWHCSAKKAATLLQITLPRLNRLRAAAELALVFQDQRKSYGRPATDSYLAAQDELYDRMRRLTVAQWSQVGERNGAARLTDREVQAIRRRAERGASTSDLAAEYGVAGSTISTIRHGHSR